MPEESGSSRACHVLCKQSVRLSVDFALLNLGGEAITIVDRCRVLRLRLKDDTKNKRRLVRVFLLPSFPSATPFGVRSAPRLTGVAARLDSVTDTRSGGGTFLRSVSGIVRAYFPGPARCRRSQLPRSEAFQTTCF